MILYESASGNVRIIVRSDHLVLPAGTRIEGAFVRLTDGTNLGQLAPRNTRMTLVVRSMETIESIPHVVCWCDVDKLAVIPITDLRQSDFITQPPIA